MNDFIGYNGASSQAITDILKNLNLPPDVSLGDVRLGEDQFNDPACRIWFVVEDDTWSEPWFQQQGSVLIDAVREAFFARDVPYWPFVYFDTHSDFTQRTAA